MNSILIDTNVFLRTLDASSPHFLSCSGALDRVRREGRPTLISAQVLAEFWSVATRPLANNGIGLTFAAAERAMDRIMRVFPCLPEPQDLALKWWDLIRMHQVISKQSHDTKLVAFMLGHGIGSLLSLNAKDFARFPEIGCVTPEEFVRVGLP